MPVRPRHLGAVPVAAALAAGLVGCGGGGTTGAAAASHPASSASAAASGTAGAANARAGEFQQRFAQVRQCLQAAGVAVPTRSPSFSGRPRPSFTPGTRPSFSPGARPSGAPRRGGFGGMLSNPQAQAALKACGISMPSFSPRSGTAAP